MDLSKKFSINFIADSLLQKNKWRPFPQAKEREIWEKLLSHPINQLRKKHILKIANELCDKPMQTIPLSLYFDFIRTGDRLSFEKLYMKRRQDLAYLILASCFSYEEKFIEASANILWAFCEESTWAISAHAERKKINNKPDLVPDISKHTLELFSCETSAILAESCYLLEHELNSISPSIIERVLSQIDERIIREFETRNDVFWFHRFNNWTVWCLSSILLASSYLIEDKLRLAKIFHRGLNLIDGFLKHYPSDYSCDEGPRYWNMSPGCILLTCETLLSRSNGRINLFEEIPLVPMGKYFADMHISSHYFFNYADTPPKFNVPADIVYRYGERICDDRLKNIALLSMRNWKPEASPAKNLQIGSRCGDLLHAIRQLFWITVDAKIKKIKSPLCIWYPAGQIFLARASHNQDKSLTLTVKGGTNGESHNHNDLGHFSIYANGHPVIVDPGCGVYRRQNFSSERYSIWYNSSRGHDVFQFGKHEQAPGGQFKSNIISFEDKENFSTVKLDLTDAYPAEAKLNFWHRTCTLYRKPKPYITINDNFDLQNPLEVFLPIFSPLKPKITEGKLSFKLKSNQNIIMSWDSKLFSAKISPLEYEDESLDCLWGVKLVKILLKCKKPQKNVNTTITISLS